MGNPLSFGIKGCLFAYTILLGETPSASSSGKMTEAKSVAVRIEKHDAVITAYIIGDIDHHTAKEIREEIDMNVEGSLPEVLILDFKDVTFMDSSGIGLVMGRYKLMQSVGGEVRVANLSDHIRKVMKLAGLDRLAVIDK